jgi:enoyl-[acyl-carrier protein] reductase I
MSLTPALNPAFAPLPLTGLRGLIMGVANEHSVAWGCARVAHQLGAQLVLTCLNDKAHAVVEPMAQTLNAPLLCCDLRDPSQPSAMMQRVADLVGTLDFVVHSVAWAPSADLQGRVVDSTPGGFSQAMQVSCHSFASLAAAAQPLMPRGGTLVTMSYLGAEEAIPNYGLMGPVKAALEALVRYLALELGRHNVRVHAVSPGPLPTRAASGLPHFDELMDEARRHAPLGRLVTLDEVGGLVAFLVGPHATGMTGQTLFVDAGRHAVQ